jgi:FKBP-type peptidyl-prolyl cis-trans isomerase FkpA
MYKFCAAATCAVFLAACGQPDSVVISAEDSESAFATDDERILYALGIALGQNIAEFSLTNEELAFVVNGMEDAVRDSEFQVNMDLYGPQIQDLANRRMMAGVELEKLASAEFAAQIAAEPGAEQTASGLVVVPVMSGDGAMPVASDTVRVHYHGTLRDGTVFDSSRGGEPVSFALNQVIPCWTEGVQKISVGGSAKLLCPSDIAYGDQSPSPDIPGGAALLFEVELLEIVE